jgi:menaquinone-specific isochorismate synthase
MTDVRLFAHTTPLAEPPDLLAFAGDDGLLWRDEHGGIAARGVAARIDLPGGLTPDSAQRVARVLNSVGSEDLVQRPGTGPVAIGALPFDPAAPGSLIIPEYLVGRAAETGWETRVTAEPQPQPQTPAAAPGPITSGDSPDEFELVSSMPHASWRQVVSDAVEAINAGDLAKVVLARRIDITANRCFVLSEVLERLVALYPSCMVFSVEGFIGASPELLISRSGDRIESHPLAGTVARSGDVHGDQALVAKLMASPKARHEHQVVVDALVAGLSPWCAEMEVPAQPSVMGLRNVSHLATHITGTLAAGPRPSALELVARVHPTPAVGGTPTDTAIKYLQSVEGFDRGCYAGPVGWMDSRGDGAWAIGIRSAVVSGTTAQLFAGNGIVAGSHPDEELAETQLKLQALLAALVRP